MSFTSLKSQLNLSCWVIFAIAFVRIESSIAQDMIHRIPPNFPPQAFEPQSLWWTNVMQRDQGKRIKKVKKYNFIIVFKNDSVLQARTNVELFHTEFIMTIGKKDDMTIVKPAQTKNVYRQLAGGKNMAGTPFDKGWIFKVNKGPIYMYSPYAEESEKYEDIIAIQKDEGPIVIISYSNLKEMIEPTSKAYNYLDETKLIRAIQIYNAEHRVRKK